MTRPGGRLAWSLFAVTLVLLAAQSYLVIASHTPLRSDNADSDWHGSAHSQLL